MAHTRQPVTSSIPAAPAERTPLRVRRCAHAYCRHLHANELASSGQPLEAERVYTEKRLVRCRL